MLIIFAFNFLIGLIFFAVDQFDQQPYAILGFIVVAGAVAVIEFLIGILLQVSGENTRTFGQALMINAGIVFIFGLSVCSA